MFKRFVYDTSHHQVSKGFARVWFIKKLEFDKIFEVHLSLLSYTSFNMFTVNWEYTCYECACPLNVQIAVKEKNLKIFLRDYGSWSYLRRFCLCLNTVMYKFYGLRVRRVCFSCYCNPKRPSVVNRECGIKMVRSSCDVECKTYKEIYEYFEDFVAYRKRKDLEECIIDRKKRTSVCGLELIWTPIVTTR